MKEASFSLTEAKFAMGDFNHLVLQNVSKAQTKLKSRKDNVAGMSSCQRSPRVAHDSHIKTFHINSGIILFIYFLCTVYRVINV